MKKIYLLFFLLPSWGVCQVPQFDASALFLLHDSDTQPHTFSSGVIQKEAAQRDLFSIVTLPLGQALKQEIRSIPVPNSAIRVGKSMAIHTDLRLGYILEHRGSIPKNITQVSVSPTMEDLEKGEFMTIVDFTDLEIPKALFKMPIAVNPTSISISSDYQHIAISSTTEEREIEVLELDESGKPIRIISKPVNLPSGRIVDVQWHPSGDFLTFINETTRTVGILRAVKDGPTKRLVRLEFVDQTIALGKKPTVGRFTPDGNYFLVLDPKKSKADFRTREIGEMYVVKLASEPGAAHYLLSRTEVGENPQDFSIASDGKKVAVCNAENSFFEVQPTEQPKSSLSLLSLNPQGLVKKVKDFPTDGLLPMAIVFDKEGKNLAVSVHEVGAYGVKVGSVEFWKYQEMAGKPTLSKQAVQLFTPRGLHSIHVFN